MHPDCAFSLLLTDFGSPDKSAFVIVHPLSICHTLQLYLYDQMQLRGLESAAATAAGNSELVSSSASIPGRINPHENPSITLLDRVNKATSRIFDQYNEDLGPVMINPHENLSATLLERINKATSRIFDQYDEDLGLGRIKPHECKSKDIAITRRKWSWSMTDADDTKLLMANTRWAS
ncbi:hypothetical protein ACQKWADRAFT_312792 [Trichoderma austrokoningii]